MHLTPTHPSAGRSLRSLLRITAAAAIMLSPIASTACRSGQQASETGAQPERPVTTLLVQNRSFMDQTVYVLRGSQRIRLGTVSGGQTQRLTIPANLIFGVSVLRFLSDPLGSSREPISNEIRVAEGDEVRMIIPP